MTERNDAYWDELGVAWCAINPHAGELGPRLKTRLQRQSLMITAGLFAGFVLGGTGLLLGLFTIWSGWGTGVWNFVVRGFAIVAISAILLIGVLRLLPVRSDVSARALSEMIDLSIARAQRTMLLVRLGVCACAIAAVLGLAGAAIRTYLTGPPKMSPVVDVAILMFVALGLLFHGRHVRDHLKKLRALRHALAVE